MKNKVSSSKKILIASLLVGVLVIGAIVSLVIVLAATQQNVSTSVKVSYIVDGVGAKVSANYYVVNPTSGAVATSVSLTNTAEGEELEFGVSDSETTKSLEPSAEEEIKLNSSDSKIVYEYKFTNTTVAPFTIALTDSMTSNNMTVRYKSSAKKITDYTEVFASETLLTQLLVEKNQTIYIYISAQVSELNYGADYTGTILWNLNYVEDSALSTLTLNNGDAGTTTLKYLADSAVQLPHLASLPTNGTLMFDGYNNASSEQVYDTTGSSLMAESGTGVTYTSQWIDAYTVSGTTLTGLSTTGQAIETLTIPSTIETIGTNALSNANAKTIVVSNSVTTIEANAFDGNTVVEEIIIEEATQTAAYADGTGYVTIGNNAFKGCKNLNNLKLSNSINTIGTSAFSECKSLISLTIPNSVTSVGDNLFYNCISLESVEISSGMTSLNNWMFYNCTNLSKITIPENILSIGNKAFYNCTKLKELVIPEGVTTIGGGVFQYMSNLEHLVLPSTVTSLTGAKTENPPLMGCEKLKTLECNADIIPQGDIYFDTQCYTAGICWLFGYGSSEDGSSDTANWFGTSTKVENIILNGGKILTYAFCNRESWGTAESYTSLKSIKISKVTSIGSGAFYGCNGLTSITIPSSVTSIGDWAFSDCSNLTSVIFKNTIGWGIDVSNPQTNATNLVNGDWSNRQLTCEYEEVDDFLVAGSSIIGLSEQGKAKTELYIPYSGDFDGFSVSAGAFEGYRNIISIEFEYIGAYHIYYLDLDGEDIGDSQNFLSTNFENNAQLLTTGEGVNWYLAAVL